MVDQPWFHNCCAALDTSLWPEALLDVCQATEREGKRERIIRWGPRTIDVDILLYNSIRLATEQLEIPHPRMTERAFVMRPLADIAPDVLVDGRSASSWANRLHDPQMELLDLPQNWWRASAA